MILYQKVTHSLTLKLVKTKNVFEIHFIHSAEAPDSPGCLNIEGFKKLQENSTKQVETLLQTVLKDMAQANKKHQDENTQLKAQIEALKKPATP